YAHISDRHPGLRCLRSHAGAMRHSRPRASAEIERGEEDDMRSNARREEIATLARSTTIAPLKPATFSKSWTFFDSDWREGNAPIMGARSHATWLGSMVFDGARMFEGVTPSAGTNTSGAGGL